AEALPSETEKLTEEDTEKMMKKPRKKKPKPDLVIPGEQFDDMFTPEFETTEEIQIQLRKKKQPDDMPTETDLATPHERAEEMSALEFETTEEIELQKEKKLKEAQTKQPEEAEELLSETEKLTGEGTEVIIKK